MNSSRQKPSQLTSWSMTDFLIPGIGVGLIIILYRRPDLFRGWGTELRAVYLSACVAFMLWGIRKPLGRWIPFLRDNKPKRSSSERSISWGGIVLVFVGLETIYWAFAGTIKWLNPLLLFLGGTYLIIWGIKEIVVRQIPSLRSVRAKQRVVLPRPGVAYLIIMFVMLGGALVGHSNMLMLVFSLMAGPFILNGWITFTMLKRLHLSREIPAEVMAGERLLVDVTLTSNKWWFSSWLMTVTDFIYNANEELVAKLLFVRVPARSSRLGQYEICLMQRGRYQFGPIRVSSRFPLGLSERGLEFTGEDELLVLPRLGTLTTTWHRNSQKATELVERQQQRRSAFDDEFHSIREYRKGDNPRAIHWRTSARQNELMVREYRQSRDRNMVLLVDLWQPENVNAQTIDNVEQAVSFAATVCVEQMKRGRNAMVRIVTAGETVSRWRGAATPGNTDSLLRNLAEVQSGTNPDINQLVQVAISSRSANTQILLITTRPVDNKITEVSDQKNIVTLLQENVGSDLLVVSTDDEMFQQYFVL